MINSRLLIGTISLVLTVSLGYWIYNVRVSKSLPMPAQSIQQNHVEKNDSVVKKGEVLHSTTNDSIVELPSSNSKPSAETVPAVVDATKIPKLFGTIIDSNKKTAIFDNPVDNTTSTYTIKDSVAGFIIADIKENKVILLKDGEIIEIGLRDPKGIKSDPLDSEGESATTTISRTRIPLLPIPPARPDNQSIPGMNNQNTSEQIPKELLGLPPTHERFNRRPVHAELESPLTPPPPIPPTFD